MLATLPHFCAGVVQVAMQKHRPRRASSLVRQWDRASVLAIEGDTSRNAAPSKAVSMMNLQPPNDPSSATGPAAPVERKEDVR